MVEIIQSSAITSIALIFIVGMLLSSLCKLCKIPGIVGMIATGIILGPYCLNLLNGNLLNISGELRQIALIIILLKAGLSLNLDDLKKVGRSAIMMSFVPASFEIIGYVIFAPLILKISYVEAAVMGAVLAAVSPAVVIPRMVKLLENGYGNEKSIPQMIMAGASCDDIFVIVLFSTFTSMAKGDGVNALSFLNIPISIILGVLLGIVVGILLAKMFESFHKRGNHVRNSMKVIIILAVSFMLVTIEKILEPYISVSGLLAVVSMACALNMNSEAFVTKRLSDKFGKLWLGAEIMLFVLVGACVNIEYTLKAGAGAIGLIFIALLFRAVGVFICMLGTKLTMKERLFCILAYLPKATVQAAIGSAALDMGLPCGAIVLSVAVLGIIITAPLGALSIDLSYKHLLNKDNHYEPPKETPPTPLEDLEALSKEEN